MRGKLTSSAIAVFALSHEKPMPPDETARLMRARRVDNRVKIRAGALYHTVERLPRDGLLAVVGTQRARRPDRTRYAMTEAGRDAFLDRGMDTGPAEPDHLRAVSLGPHRVSRLSSVNAQTTPENEHKAG